MIPTFGLRMSPVELFDCPNCKAQYKLVRAEAGSSPILDKQIECRHCGAPFRGREGRFILKYFLVDRPKAQAIKRR